MRSKSSVVIKFCRGMASLRNRVEEAVLCYTIVLLALFLILDVITREAGYCLYYSTEISNDLVILLTFVGLGYGVRRARHISMAAFFDLASRRAKKILVFVMSFVSSLVMFLMSYLAVTFVLQARAMEQATPSLRLPYWWFIAIIPVCFFYSGIQYALTFRKNILEREVWISSEQKSMYENGNADGEN